MLLTVLMLFVFLLLAIAGAMTCLETALFSLSRYQRREMEGSDPVAGKQVTLLLQQPRRLFITIGFTRSLLTVTMAAVGFQAGELIQKDGGWWAIPVLGGFLVVFGFIIPRAYAVQNAKRVAARGAVFLTRWISTGGVIATSLHQMVRSLMTALFYKTMPLTAPLAKGEEPRHHPFPWERFFQLGNKSLREIMTPRSDLIALSSDLSLEDLMVALKKQKRRRVPVFDGTLNNIVSVINTKKFLLEPSEEFGEQFEMPAFVPSSMSAGELLRGFREHGERLAIVRDDKGETLGVVTAEDLMGEIFGNLDEEFGQPEVLIATNREGMYVFRGDISLVTVNERLKLKLSSANERHTIADFLREKIPHVPKPGDSVQVPCATSNGTGNVTLIVTVLKVAKNIIGEVALEVRPQKGDA